VRPSIPERLRRILVPLVLFLGAALISAFTMLRGFDVFDEGLALQAAERVGTGEMPYRDFLWSYGPAGPYLLGALSELFGSSLVHWRVLRVLADAGVALAVFALVRREAGTLPALFAWLAAACAMAQSRSANPFALAFLFGLLALALASSPWPGRRRLPAAAALTALAAAFRLDFGVYAGAAVVVALLLEPAARAARIRAAGSYALLASVLTLLVYLPFAVADGPADLWDALVATSLREKEWWTLPFPFDYDGALWPPSDLDDALEFHVPLLLLIGLGLAAGGAALRAAKERALPPAWGGLLVLGAGGLAYLLSRTDEFHVTPLLVVLAGLLPPVAAWAVRAGEEDRLNDGIAALLAVSACFVFGLLLADGFSNRATALLRPPELERLDLPVADGVRAPPAEARALEALVPLVQRLVPAGEPVYVAPLRSDLVAFNNPLLYVLLERGNATDRDFGVLARPVEQRRTVAQLERARPRVVVRWTDPFSARREPNERGRSSGDRSLDEYLERAYAPSVRAGDYVLLLRREPEAGLAAR
jgi:Dolichyl-phosphate-mannose-protein mannosyltransferase